MHLPGYIERARTALRARPWSLSIAALVSVLAVAAVYSMTVEPVLRPYAERALGEPAYTVVADASDAIAAGKARAAASGKHLMVTFGANWCPDCLTLHDNLGAPDARAYVEKHFEIVEIDVGDAKKSAAVERDLGIAINAIPLAVFYSPTGELVGDTFGGELKPSRHYSSREIRDFLREVVDYHRIVSPDQRQ